MLCRDWEAAGSARETEAGSSTGYLLGKEGMCRMLMWLLGPGEKSQHFSSLSYLVVAYLALSCMVCTALSGAPDL